MVGEKFISLQKKKQKMMQTAPKEVKKIVSEDLKVNLGLTRQEVASKLGYLRKESFNNLMIKDAYFPARVAKLMSDIYDYNFDFLVRGEGSLHGSSGDFVLYEGVHKDMFEKDLILKMEELGRTYGKEVASFITILSTWWGMFIHGESQDEPFAFNGLLDLLRENYNEMMRYSGGTKPFLGHHPTKK
jgi:hypothetical protein